MSVAATSAMITPMYVSVFDPDSGKAMYGVFDLNNN